MLPAAGQLFNRSACCNSEQFAASLAYFLLLFVVIVWAVGNGYVGRWLGFSVGPVQHSFFFGLSKMTAEGGCCAILKFVWFRRFW